MTPYAWTLPSGLVARVHDPAEWCIFCEIFVDGEYAAAIRQAFAAAPRDGNFHFLDLGANHGLFTLHLLDQSRRAKFSARFHGLLVEAAQANCTLLKNNLSQLPADWAALEIHHAAVGPAAGFVDLWHHGASHTTHSVHATPANRARGGHERVPTLDVIVTTRAWPRIDLLKMDIEGAEESFFDNFSAILEKTSVLCYELHPDLCNKEKISTLLTDRGFVLHELLGKVNGPEQILTWIKSPNPLPR
jgi:FkbM family methyltransferase